MIPGVFGESVRAFRQRSGLTQEELAARAGVSVRSIRDIEAGRTGRAVPVPSGCSPRRSGSPAPSGRSSSPPRHPARRNRPRHCLPPSARPSELPPTARYGALLRGPGSFRLANVARLILLTSWAGLKLRPDCR